MGHAPSCASSPTSIKKGEFNARIHRISRPDQHTPKVVWHKKVVGLLYVVETTSVSVVMASQVVSSAGKRGTS